MVVVVLATRRREKLAETPRHKVWTKIKDESRVVPKMARRRGSDAGQSRRSALDSTVDDCRRCKNSSVLSYLDNKTKEGCDRGSKLGTVYSGWDGEGLAPLKKLALQLSLWSPCRIKACYVGPWSLVLPIPRGEGPKKLRGGLTAVKPCPSFYPPSRMFNKSRALTFK